MNVDWNKWGEVLDWGQHKEIIETGDDGIPTVVGYIGDELRYITEPEERPITKKEIMAEIEGWKNDDGTYGDDDTHITIAYDDGTFFANDMSGGNYREKMKKTGIIGASLSTADYEMVWGGEMNRKTGQIEPYKTWVSPYDEEEGREGKSNSYSGYKTVGMYRVRVKTTYNNKYPNGRSYTKHEIIRKSKVKKVDW